MTSQRRALGRRADRGAAHLRYGSRRAGAARPVVDRAFGREPATPHARDQPVPEFGFGLRPTEGRPEMEPPEELTGAALLALVDHAFADARTERVVAETMAVNVASRRVMEKCGLRLVRIFHTDWPVRIPGDEHGDVEYELTRNSWLARSPR